MELLIQDCNTCKHHKQGEHPPSRCQFCLAHPTNFISLPFWEAMSTLEEAYEDPRPMREYDPVTKPMHYVQGRQYEPVKVINDWGLNFNLGNAVKYISRAGRKGDKKQDLEKAVFYLQEEIRNGL